MSSSLSARTDQRIRFPGANGHLLAARLELPDSEPLGFALFAHCFTCSKDLKAMRRISRVLAEQGIGVLRFDFTGLGESEGEFADTDFSSNIEDLLAAADYLRQHFQAPQLLVGHSLGGTAALAAAARIAETRAVATIAAPSDTDHIRQLLVEKSGGLEGDETAEIQLAGRRFQIKQRMLRDLAEHAVRDFIGELKRPLLIFHSPLDNVVGIEHARRIFETAKHPKSFVSLDNADHLLLDNDQDADFVGQVLGNWAKRYLAGPASTEPEASDADQGQVTVTSQGSGLRHEVVAGTHHLISDEPRNRGGEDAGPDPYGFLLAGLGACTGMTLRMYANHKKWSLADVRVHLSHRRIHAKDCAECETTEGKVDVIERVLEITGDLSQEQRQRLTEIADRCPVSRTLTSETRVVTRTADAAE
jgi:putative redox protein